MTIKQIGAEVRKARGQRSISEVAEAAGLERHQVKGIEAGSKAYTINSLLALCKALGLGLVFQAKATTGRCGMGTTECKTPKHEVHKSR